MIREELSNTKEENKIKVIIITYRLIDNLEFRPAEEVFLRIMINKLGLNYEKIEYLGTKVNNLFSHKLPSLYFNGKFINNKNIFHFIKDLIINQIVIKNKESFNRFYDNLVYTLRNELRIANEFYYYLKIKEKLTSSSLKTISAVFKKNFHVNKQYELLINDICGNVSYSKNPYFSFLGIEEKIVEIIKNSNNKINIFKEKDFFNTDLNLILQFTIYSFIKEDRTLFFKVKRPAIDNLKYEESYIYNSIGAFYNKVDNLIGNKSAKFNFNLAELDKELILKHSILLNTKKKMPTKNIQEIEIKNNIYHNLFAVITFVGFGLILFYLSSRPSNKK